jgi:LDH2 family malate/lactate/ureidoglycolate dehydrogenase
MRGGVDPRGCPRLINDASAALVVDGNNSMGQVAGAFAMRQVIEPARVTIVAVTVVATATIAAPWSTMCAWRSTPT